MCNGTSVNSLLIQSPGVSRERMQESWFNLHKSNDCEWMAGWQALERTQ